MGIGMKVLLKPKGIKKIYDNGKEKKFIYSLGYIENPESFNDVMLKAYFGDVQDIIDKLEEVNIAHKIVCKIICENKKHNMYILECYNKYFIYYDIHNEIKFDYELKLIQLKIEDLLKKAKKMNYRFNSKQFKILMRIKEIKKIENLTKDDINNFYEIQKVI